MWYALTSWRTTGHQLSPYQKCYSPSAHSLLTVIQVNFIFWLTKSHMPVYLTFNIFSYKVLVYLLRKMSPYYVGHLTPKPLHLSLYSHSVSSSVSFHVLHSICVVSFLMCCSHLDFSLPLGCFAFTFLFWNFFGISFFVNS